MADATYQPYVYRDDGGNRLNVVSGGKVNIESGSSVAVATDLEIASGGALKVQSGGSAQIASGGYLSIASGGYQTVPVQTLASSTGGTVTNFGVTLLTGTTSSVAYSMAAPTAAGMLKELILNPSSSGVTHRCTVYTGSTGISLNSTGANTITLSTSALTAVTLRSVSTTEWRVVGSVGAYAGFSNKST